MLGSNPSAHQVSKKGRGGSEVNSFAPTLLLKPFGETKAKNPGGLGAEPPMNLLWQWNC